MKYRPMLVVVLLVVGLPVGFVWYAHGASWDTPGSSGQGSVERCNSTTHTFETEYARLRTVGQIEDEQGSSTFRLNVSVSEAGPVRRLEIVRQNRTIRERPVSGGNYTFTLDEIGRVTIRAMDANGTVVDHAIVDYRCSESTVTS